MNRLDLSGVPKIACEICSKLDRGRFQALLVSVAGDGPLSRQLLGDVPHEIIDDQTSLRWGTWKRPSAIYALARLLRRGRIDVVQTHWFPASVIGRLSGILAGTPVVLDTIHTTPSPFPRWQDRIIHRFLAGFTDCFVCVSETVEQAARGSPGYDGGKYRVIRNGVNQHNLVRPSAAQAKRLLSLPDTRPVIGAIGRLVPQKHMIDLIAAAPHVLREVPAAIFVVAGDGPQREFLEAEVTSRGLKDHFLLLGSRSDIEVVYAASDVIASTSEREGLPLGLLEAMTFGRPIVAYAISAVEECLADAGLLVPFGRVDALAAGFVSVLTDAHLRADLSRKALQRSVCFDADQMVREYERLYLDLLSRRVQPGSSERRKEK